MTGGSSGAEISQEKKKEFKTASSDDQWSAISVMPVVFTETDKKMSEVELREVSDSYCNPH